MIKNILNLGDAALYCDFGDQVNKDINSNVINYFKNIKELNIKGITNIVPSYNKLIITFDLDVNNFQKLKKRYLCSASEIPGKLQKHIFIFIFIYLFFCCCKKHVFF